AALYHSAAMKVFKEASKKAGADFTPYDIFEELKQLGIEQKSMSDDEKRKRIVDAKVAYYDMFIDQITYDKSGDEKLKKGLDEKKEQLKAQYGRVLLFDQENTEANVALGDLYWDEGNKVDSVAFYYKGLKNADEATIAKIERRLDEVYNAQAASIIGFSKVPEPTEFQVLALMREENDDPSVTEIIVRDRIRLATSLVRSVELSPNRWGLLKLVKDSVLSVNEDKVNYLGGADE
ncbi:hypothetical protein ACFLZN_00745, partial [Nanoarchaeota archaeon]